MDDLDDMRLDQLTAELAWIRRLAYALVKDASTADDVAQDTILAAAGKVPADRPLRPWLSRVVLNLVRMRARTDRRRASHEAAAPASEPVPTADELVDRVELQRAIVDEVLALDEPYRSTVLLHFFEGMTSAEIARRLDLPDGTVRRRLKTALDMLRERLGKKHERRGGLAAFLPIIAAPAGDLAMKKTVIGLAVLAVLLVGGLWMWKGRGEAHDSSPGAPASTQGAAGGAPGAGGGTAGDPSGPGSRAQLAAPVWFAQRGVSERRIAGVVTAGGTPLAGAVVRLGSVTSGVAQPGPGNDRSGDELASKVTGADGRFDFGTVPAALYVVSAEAEAKTPASTTISAADPRFKTEHIALELGPCKSRLYGHVVDASGGGVAKARLRVAGIAGTESNAAGEYTLCVPWGDSQVRVDADGYGGIDRPFHLVGEAKHDFELVPEAVLAGTVVDERGAAVPFAQVIAVPQAIEQPHFLGDGHTTADAQGKFRIENLAPGRFMLAASTPDHGAASAKPAVAAPGAANAEITLVLAKRATIRGKVVMAGKPVEGARMSIAGPDLVKRSAFSQADGSFVLEGVPFGTQQLDAGTYEVEKPQSVDVKGDLDGVTVEVEEMAGLHGTITRKGNPVPDAVVQTSIGPSARSDKDGKYEIDGLPVGAIQVSVQGTGAIAAFAPFQKVTTVAGRSTQYDVELTGAAEVRGTVVDTAGNPVPNVYVFLNEPKLGDLGESMTDANGAFRCTSMLGGGSYRVAVTPSPGARVPFKLAPGSPTEIAVADGDTILNNITLSIVHERVSIAGRVIDEGGNPVADVHVEAIGSRGGAFPGAMLPSIRADAQGNFEIGNLAKGVYLLHARAGDGSEAEVHDIATGTRDVVVKLVRPGAIEGTLAGFSREPRVRARSMTGAMNLQNEAVVDGSTFSITGLAPGKYIVEAQIHEESAGQTVDIKPGAIARVKLESKGRGTVEGTLVDFTTRQPLPGFSCVAALSVGGAAGNFQPGAATPANTTDAKGMFKIPAPIGKARVMCFPSDSSYSVAGGDVEVAATGSARIDLKAVKAEPPPSDPGFRIRGLILPLVIALVDPAGPAKAAGLAPGDKVVTIDGVSTAGLLPSGAMMLAFNKRPGSTLTLGIERSGAPLTIKIAIEKTLQ